MTLAAAERAALCDFLLELGPEAPTLCEGWTTRDLAAHLWTREHDPASLPGLAPGLERIADARRERALERLGYEGLVDDLRTPALAIRPVDAAMNAIEFFVHHEDVRRAAPGGAAPRPLDPADEDELWDRLRSMGPMLARGAGAAVIAERTDPGRPVDRLRLAGRRGTAEVIARGRPSELVLLAFGRGRVADVELTGSEQAVAAVLAAKLGL